MRLTETSEQELIKHILYHYDGLYWFFNFVVEPALGPPGPDRKAWDYRIYCNVERRDLGLEPDGKPGDVDVLIVPVRNGVLAVQNCMAVEVKRLYLRAAKRSRDTNSSGAEQAAGLVRDGFPFVGLLHIVVAEESPKTEFAKGSVVRVLDELGNAEMLPGEVMVDPIGRIAPERQLGRLEARVKNQVIGLNSVCVFLNADGSRIIGNSTGPSRLASRNPINNSTLLRRVEQLCAVIPLSRRDA